MITPTDKSNFEKGYYIFSNSDVEKHLCVKSELDCWENYNQWSQNKPPANFDCFFKKFS